MLPTLTGIPHAAHFCRSLFYYTLETRPPRSLDLCYYMYIYVTVEHYSIIHSKLAILDL